MNQPRGSNEIRGEQPPDLAVKGIAKHIRSRTVKKFKRTDISILGETYWGGKFEFVKTVLDLMKGKRGLG